MTVTDTQQVNMSEVLAGLASILDIVEGQPPGHVLRSCLIGMRIGERIGLDDEQRSSLFYALLLKDAGCSSNAARISAMFDADDFVSKYTYKTVDWTRQPDATLYVMRTVSPDGSIWSKARQVIEIGRQKHSSVKQLIEIRCERGAGIARLLGLSEDTAVAIRNLDEHWDGAGHPDGASGGESPLLARICGLAQTVDVFYSQFGPVMAENMVLDRRGTWFDPVLADILLAEARAGQLWTALESDHLSAVVEALEPASLIIPATPERLDLIAVAFSQIIDAKSPYTSQHSAGVARVAALLAQRMGFSERAVQEQERAGLLHDIGKLGVSNRILDKPGKLTDAEFREIQKHPELTYQTLVRVGPLAKIAEVSALHHERLDGSGYYRGMSAHNLGLSARILAVADVYDALVSDRPYRAGMPIEQALAIIRTDAGSKLCPECVEQLVELAPSLAPARVAPSQPIQRGSTVHASPSRTLVPAGHNSNVA